MNIKFEKIIIKLLSENIDLNEFDCGNSDLNEFLIEDAIIQQKEMLNVTHIFIYEKRIIGFLTISMGNVNIKQLDKKYQEIYENKGINYKTIPTVKLGRLAIAKNYQKSGLGTFMIKWSQYCIIKFSKRIGVRFIAIDAYMNVIDFYSKNEFEITHKTKQNMDKIIEKYKKALKVDKKRAQQITVPMFSDLKKI